MSESGAVCRFFTRARKSRKRPVDAINLYLTLCRFRTDTRFFAMVGSVLMFVMKI